MENMLKIDVDIMRALIDSDSTNAISGKTIDEIMRIVDKRKARSTFYRRLCELEKNGLIAQGCLDSHATTYYIMENGVNYMKYGTSMYHNNGIIIDFDDVEEYNQPANSKQPQYMTELVDAIREEMQNRALSFQDVSDKIGMKVGTLKNKFSKKTLHVKDIVDICHAFNFSLIIKDNDSENEVFKFIDRSNNDSNVNYIKEMIAENTKMIEQLVEINKKYMDYIDLM